MNAKISIIVKSFDPPKEPITGIFKNSQSMHFPKQVYSLRLPKKRTLYTVLRSPHIDKKSREQFEMRSHKQVVVIHTSRTDMQKQLVNLKLHSIPGIQLKVVVNYQTRLA